MRKPLANTLVLWLNNYMTSSTNTRVLARNGNGFVAHLGHDEHSGGSPDPEHCDHCYVREQGWLREIHEAIFDRNSDVALQVSWKLQDGYGVPGFTPEQGFDWSGIRDSSPAAIQDMIRALRA